MSSALGEIKDKLDGGILDSEMRGDDKVWGEKRKNHIPFDGNTMCDYQDPYTWKLPNYRGKVSEIIWYPFQAFYAEMSFDGVSRGRSSCKFLVSDECGNKFEMFPNDVLEVMQNYGAGPRTEGYWNFVKRGANYGVIYIGEELSET